MAFQCNIDHRGRRYRLTMGVVCLVVAVALLVAAWRGAGRPLGVIGVAALTAAVLCIGQALAGYCVFRGLGFRTRV